MPPPVTGTGEPARTANGLNASGALWLQPSINGDDSELEDSEEEGSLSLAPSAPAARLDGDGFIVLG